MLVEHKLPGIHVDLDGPAVIWPSITKCSMISLPIIRAVDEAIKA